MRYFGHIRAKLTTLNSYLFLSPFLGMNLLEK